MMHYEGGYGTPYGYQGIWEDTQAFVLENLPSWATGVVAVDVPEGREGVQALEAMIPELEGEDKVLLSARAQMALWTMLQEAADSLDRQMLATADIGGRTGEQIRAFLEAQKGEIAAQAMQLARSNDAALEGGIEPAYMDEWFPVESARAQIQGAAAVATSPVIWTVVVAIVIASAVLATSITVAVIWSKKLDIVQQEAETQGMTPEDKYSYVMRRAEAREMGGGNEFPWGWVAGIGVGGVAIALLIAWAEGTLGRWTSKLSGGGRSILRPYGQ